MRKHLLIIGGDSRIGSHLAAYWRQRGLTTYATTRRRFRVGPNRPFLDLNDCQHAIDFSQFHSAIICAAVHNMAICEAEPERSQLINVHATLRLVSELLKANAHLVFPSSNAVFDGTKPFCSVVDEPRPRNLYGRQKLAVELAIDKSKAAIIRMTKVINPSMPLLKEWEIDSPAFTGGVLN